MVNKLKKTLLFLLCASFAVLFCGCSEFVPGGASVTAAAEGGDTVIEVAMKIDGHGKIESVRFDEIFEPRQLAVAANADGDNTVEYFDGKKSEYYYKYLYIDSVLFTAEVTDTGVFYSNKDREIDDLNSYAMSAEEGLLWYYNAVKDNKAFYGRKGKDGPEITETAFTAPTGSVRKRDSDYWPAGGYGKGYEANMSAIEEYLVENGVGGLSNYDNIVNDGGIVKINGIATGATLANAAHPYLRAAQRAYELCYDLI